MWTTRRATVRLLLRTVPALHAIKCEARQSRLDGVRVTYRQSTLWATSCPTAWPRLTVRPSDTSRCGVSCDVQHSPRAFRLNTSNTPHKTTIFLSALPMVEHCLDQGSSTRTATWLWARVWVMGAAGKYMSWRPLRLSTRKSWQPCEQEPLERVEQCASKSIQRGEELPARPGLR